MRYLIIITCCYTHVLFAQPVFRTVNMYTTQNGLSDNTVYCINQDSRGFLWIGTKEGLNRFDGFRFKRFFAAKDPDKGLAGNTVNDIVENTAGQLLVGTANGLSIFNTLTGCFENEKIKKAELKAGSGTLINSLYKDKDGNIWINHSGELDVLDSNLNYLYRFTNLPWAKDIKGIIVRYENWFTDNQNRLWLPADTSSIHIIDFKQKKVWNSRNNPQRYEFLEPRFIRSALLDEASNVLWYSRWGEGLYRYDLTTHVQQRQDFGFASVEENRSVNEIIKLNAEKILCINGYGCFIVDAATLQYDRVPMEIPGLSGHRIDVTAITLFKSANGNYWVGTLNGLFQLQNEDAAAKAFTFGGEGTSIARSRTGKLYVSCNNNILIEAEKDLSGFRSYSIPGNKSVRLTCVAEDNSENVWIGSMTGLYLFNAINKKFTQPGSLHPDLYSARINFIYRDREEKIWFATWLPFGLYRYDPLAGQCEKISNAATNNFEKLGELSRISYITEDNKQRLWMISKLGGGIICYDKTTGDWNVYPRSDRHRNLLLKGIGSLYPDDTDYLWLHDVFGTGLLKYDYRNDSITFVTRNDNLPSDFIKSMSFDDSHNLWILTEYGISQFDLRSQKITSNLFFRSNRLDPTEFLVYDSLSRSMILSAKNLLLFYPVNDINAAKKETLHPVIDKISVNSKEILEDVNGQSLTFEPGQTNISIDFTVVHYSNSDKIRFAYQLAGADHDWKYAGVDRSVQYAVLTPGTYVFKIKLADENGNWSEPVDSFSFTIVPYFWQTNLFKIALLLLSASLLFYFIRRRIKNIRHEAEMNRQIAESEMLALRAQMNPHFIFNCLTAIDNLIQTNQKEKATTYLARFAKLIRNVLDSSKNATVLFQNDLESLRLYLLIEQFRSNNHFDFEIDVDPQLIHGDFKVPPLVVQPFVENAIHHGLLNKLNGTKKLTISAKVEGDAIKIKVTDNGVGRIRAKQIREINNPGHESYGISLSRERIQLYNKNGSSEAVKINDLFQDNEPAGTEVEVKIMIHDKTE